MTEEELIQIIKRDMPGWDLAKDFRLNHRFKGEGNFIVGAFEAGARAGRSVQGDAGGGGGCGQVTGNGDREQI